MPHRKTSTTAYAVASGLAKLARLPEWKGYFPDEMVNLNTAFMLHARDTPVKHLISWLPSRGFLWVMDNMFIPGMGYHFLFRKRLIESRLNDAVAEGVQQVIVLGAGLDTLAVRMARKYPKVQFFEIDLPGTQQAKLSILERIGHPVPPNCVFVQADLAQETLEATLHSAQNFSPDAPTLVILEGVLMYLTESEVKALFTSLRGLINAPLTIIFGATVTSDDAGNRRVQMVNAFLHRGQEATQWHCPSAAMPGFMADLGYELKEWMSYKQLQRFYRSEQVIRVVPDEDENYYAVAKMPRPPTNAPVLDIHQISFILVKS